MAEMESPALDFSAIEEMDPSLADGYRIIYAREVQHASHHIIFLMSLSHTHAHTGSY